MADGGTRARLTPAEWRRICAVLDRVHDAPAATRQAALAEACRDESLAVEDVRPFLDAEAKSTSLPELVSAELMAEAFADAGDEPAPRLETGTRLGPYEIVECVGTGGMGEVYRAQDTRLERPVAVKVLRPHLLGRPDTRERFDREARAISSLNHQHVCTLHDVGHQGGIDFLVMEYVEGETLAARLGRGALPLGQALRFGSQIADALDRAHRLGIVHRDLKPANIMITRAGVKLLDFGLARVGAPGALESRAGTPGYMAPEQVQGREADARGDIYACGMVLSEMITGRRDPPVEAPLAPGVPASLDFALSRCLAEDPDDRWQSAADLRHQLEWIAAHPAVVDGARPRRPVPVWTVAAVVVALAAAGAWGWAHRLPDSREPSLSTVPAGASDSPDTPVANATVRVNDGSGTLIAPDLVLTNGHVAQVPIPPARPPFSRTDAHDPARWYAIPNTNTVTVLIGADPGRVVLTTSAPLTSPRTRWEIHDADGGTLLDGDFIGLKTSGHFAFVDGGRRGGEVRIDPLRDRFAEWQVLTLEKVSGSSGATIRGGDHIALKANDGSYLAATQSNGLMVADSTARAARHEFAILTFDERGAHSEDVIEGGGTVAIGAVSPGVGFMQAPYRVEGIAIATPGYDDLAVIRLRERVPDDIARPVPIKLRLGPGDPETIDDFYQRAALTVAGYGLMAGAAEPIRRQQATVGNALRETAGRTAGLSTKYSAQSAGRVSTQTGAHGGSWFVETPRGLRLAGITHGSNNRFLTPMYRGGSDSAARSKPDLHAWFSMLLADDDCVAADETRGPIRETAMALGARDVCRFGDAGAPFAVAYPGALGNSAGAECVTFDPARLSLRRPDAPEGPGSTTWTLVEGRRPLMRIEGTWQQAYLRGAYLISFLERREMNQACFSKEPNTPLTYFRN